MGSEIQDANTYWVFFRDLYYVGLGIGEKGELFRRRRGDVEPATLVS